MRYLFADCQRGHNCAALQDASDIDYILKLPVCTHTCNYFPIDFIAVSVNTQLIKQINASPAAAPAPASNQTTEGDVSCVPLFPPRHGYLECTRSVVEGRKRRVTNRRGTVCILKCPVGFHVVGAYSRICGPGGTWEGPDNGTCASEFNSN